MKKKGFIEADTLVAIALFSILSITAMNIILSYRNREIICIKREEANYYYECIIKECKYQLGVDKIKDLCASPMYINKTDINSNSIEKKDLKDILSSDIEDGDKYIKIYDTDDKVKIEYVDNTRGEKFKDDILF